MSVVGRTGFEEGVPAGRSEVWYRGERAVSCRKGCEAGYVGGPGGVYVERQGLECGGPGDSSTRVPGLRPSLAAVLAERSGWL